MTNNVKIKETARTQIGEAISQARKSQGLTTRQLADLCGLSHSHIVRVESGRYAVTIDTIAILTHTLGLSITLS